jgi:hypothetical protein
MKITIAFTTLILTSAASINYAGNMGVIQTKDKSISNYFVTAEALHAWKSVGTFYQNNVPVPPTTNGWGGRFGAGIMKPYTNNLSFSAEAGWGYYGKIKYINSTVGWNKTSYAYGFDLLLGAFYPYKQLDVFLKAGAMFQNYKFIVNQNLGNQIQGGVVSGVYHATSSQANVVPEVKFGGIYNINESLGVTLAYMYIAGAKIQGNVSQIVIAGSSATNGTTNTEMPSFSAVTFGLNYKF